MNEANQARSTLARWLGRAAALMLGIALSALLLEGAVLALFGPQVRFPRHVVGAPWGLRFNQPGAVYRHKSADVEVWFHINAQGMRSPRDFAYAKPPGVKRIVVLGDSFTAGYEVSGEQCYASVLERALRSRGESVEVLNAGVSGFGTAEEYLYLERELWKYQPDVVVLAFYTNDFSDNLRSGLFTLSPQGALEPAAHDYVPAGRLGDFLNTNPVFNWLSGYSNAFAFVKERATEVTKREMVRESLDQVDASKRSDSPAIPQASGSYEQRLTAAILSALANSTRAHGVPLVILSIPFQQPEPLALVETFPRGFDPQREGVWFLPMKRVLDPFVGRKLLYWTRSHGHWTPFAQARAGDALAALIEDQGLLGRAQRPSVKADPDVPIGSGGGSPRVGEGNASRDPHPRS